MANKPVKCAFCGKEATDEDRMIVSNLDKHPIAICEDCIGLSYDIIQAAIEEEEETDDEEKIPTPHAIKEFLDTYIISQENAKMRTAVAIFNHLKQVKYNENIQENSKKEPLQGTNMVCIGSTGTGKTAIFRAAAKLLNVPFVTVDSSSLTSAGFVGADVTDCLVQALRDADGDVELAEHSIIFFDEVDKIARKSGKDVSAYKDVSGESVQQSLLKMLEGSEIEVPVSGKRSAFTEMLTMDTSNILFILNGSFEGLEKIIKHRVNKKKIGLGEEYKDYTDDDYLGMVTPQDLVEYGILPEIVGRAPSIVTLHSLSKENLIDILTKPKNAIVKQYAELLKMDGVKLSFKKDVLEHIAELAIERKTNARGLRAIMDNLLSPLMYDIPEMDNIHQLVISHELKDGMSLAKSS